jgi:hypothetical protein
MTAPINSLVRWLEQTHVHQFMQTVEWAVPAVQTIHILAIAAVFASSLVLSGRTLRLVGGDWSLAQWGKRLNGWIGWGLVVLLVSGVLMICGEPGRSLSNTLFRVKVMLLLVAIALLIAFVRRIKRLGESAQPTPAGVRILGACLMLVWLAMIICGRWIAYT